MGILAMNCAEYLEVYGVGEVAPFIVAPINFRLAAPEILCMSCATAPRACCSSKSSTRRPSTRCAAICRRYGATSASVARRRIGPRITRRCSPRARTAPRSRGAPGAPARHHVHQRHHRAAEGRHADACGSGRAARGLGARARGRCGRSHPVVDAAVPHRLALTGGALTYVGGTMVILRAFDAAAIVQTIPRERITQLHLAPMLVQQVLDSPGQEGADFGSLKTLNYAAAPMPLTVLQRALRRFGRIMINGFGQDRGGQRAQEALPSSRWRRARSQAPHVGGAGRDDHERRHFDEQDREVPRGTVGEICFHTPSTMSATGTMPRRPSRRCATAGCIRATSAAWTRTASSTSWTARRT